MKTLSIKRLAAVLLLSALLASAGHARVVERVVAVVDKEIILLSELRAQIAPFSRQLAQITDPSEREARVKQLHQQALERMINDALIEQEARRLKLEVAPPELDRAIGEVMRRNNMTAEQLEAALQQEGKTLADYKRMILRPQLLRLKVLNIQVRSRVAVSDDELKALYQKNLRSLGVETRLRARHIFIMIPKGAKADGVAERRAFAKTLLARAREGASFADLARQYSDDSVTRGEGGDLGYFTRGTLPADVEDVVFSLKKGEIRGPLRTSRGFHLIELLDREESSARPFEQVKNQLREQLQAGKMEKATKAWLKEVRKKAYVDIKL